MATVFEGITVNADKSLNFGHYMVKEKIKVKDFDLDGDLYNVKTHDQVTRLEQNGKLLVECVPGAAFGDFSVNETGVRCQAFGNGLCNITLELAPETGYRLNINSKEMAEAQTNKSGKLSFSAELSDTATPITITRL